MAIWRVLAVEGEDAVLWRQGETRRAHLPPGIHARPGDLFDAGWRQLGHSQHADFPHPDGDFARLSADNSARLRNLQQRARLLATTRKFFDKRGFLEVDPPVMALSPGLELHLDAVEVTLRQGMGGTHVQRHLVTSPEFHCKRLLSAGLEHIYSLGHVFRSGERGQFHNPEFAMLEWYRAGGTWQQIVRDFQGLARTCQKALGKSHETLDLRGRWPVLSVRQAVQRFAGFDPGRCEDEVLVKRRARAAGLQVDAQDGIADVLVRVLAERVEPKLAAFAVVVIADWPLCMASLARPNPKKPWLAERFEIYLAGVEIANGFGELVEPLEQRRRFEADLAHRRQLGRPEYPIDERFLRALADGLPASAGVAVGVDRLLMLLLGLQDIESVLAFPFERA
jgi:lysyl-tRNA synthetase class 2